MRRLPRELSLHLIAGVIALSILAISAVSLWNDREDAWLDAERGSRNLLTALAQDISSNLEIVDLTLKDVSEDALDPSLLALPPEARHRIMFGRTRAVDYMGGILIFDAKGQTVADSASVSTRRFNASDRDYFLVHKERADVGIYLSRPLRSRLDSDELSIVASRRLSLPDGTFAGVVASRIPLSKFNSRFKDLDIGRESSITLFRNDGVVFMRKPYMESEIGQDLSNTSNVRRFIREGTGSFEGTAALDGIRRLYVFGRVDGFPLLLAVSKGVDELLLPWRAKAVIQGVITLLICGSLIGLTVLFQRELRLRTRAEKKLQRIARTDDLTGLPNRRAFREEYDRAWRRASRLGSPLSVLFVDADYFKNFNDEYGHRRGDEVLCAIAEALKVNTRRLMDMAARYGGEEFVILLPDSDPGDAREVAVRIHQSILSLGIEHATSPHRFVTASIGIASMHPSDESDKVALLEAADAALYAAKTSGRSCIREHGAEGAIGRRETEEEARLQPVGGEAQECLGSR